MTKGKTKGKCQFEGCRLPATAMINAKRYCQKHFTTVKYLNTRQILRQYPKCRVYFKELYPSKTGKWIGKLVCYRCIKKLDGFVPFTQPGRIKTKI